MVLDDWVVSLSDQVTLLSGNVLRHNNGLLLNLELHAGGLESLLGILVIFIADESCSVFLEIDGGGDDVSELLEKVMELSIAEVAWKILNEQICVVFANVFSLVLLDVVQDIDLVAHLLATVEFGDGS